MAEGFEHYHIPQQSRREKLRVLSQNQTAFLESSSTLHTALPSLYDPSLISSDLLACINQNNVPLSSSSNNNNELPCKPNQGGGSVKEERSNLMMRFAAAGDSSPSSVSHHAYLDPEAAIQVITNSTNPFLYQPQNLREFSHGYNDGSGGEVVMFKPETLSLSLSSHKNNNHNHNHNHHPLLELNLQRYGSVVNGGSGFDVTRNTVPLGPFTGYASVLKGSRFLKPAQQLLDEICDVGVRGICSQKFTADVSLMETSPQESGINGLDDPLVGDGNNNEGRKNKSRLVTMLDEVYRRYRQYYQQINTVVTSFEYVAGLGNAAPYASLAINAMSKHFRCLKNAITDQLQFISKSHFQINNTRKDESPRFRNCDGGPYSQRPGFLEHQQQPVWRPQRGLPERAVSVLRAWLFEHFLHPYPTDTDKIMLAKQTGLSRNQVSNWFINARVRLWKPMVEEIHMLESQQTQKKSQREEHGRNNLSDHLPSDNNNIAENPSTSSDKFHDVPYKRTRNELPNMPARNQEPQLNQTNTSSNHRVGVGVSMGTNGASNGVSLTLGLHHQNHGIGLSEPFSMSAAQRFGLALQPEGYVTSGFQSQNRQFGGTLLHDFVG